MFTFNPLEVGNPMTLGMIEEELESKIDKMVVDSKQGRVFRVRDVLSLLKSYNTEYSVLPKYLQNKIDEIELLWKGGSILDAYFNTL